MAYKQNNPFSRKASPLNNGDGLDLERIEGDRYYVRPVGDEAEDDEMIVGKRIGEVTGAEYVLNRPGGRGARVDYIPSQESLQDQRSGKLLVTDEVYDTGKAMVKDSLNLVNRGRGVKAAQLYGRNLGENLRAGNFEAKVRKNIAGIHDEENTAYARNMKNTGSRAGFGSDVRSGEQHVDFDKRTTSLLSPRELESYRKRKGYPVKWM